LPQVQVVAGDLTRPDTLGAAVDGVDAIVFTHGSDGGGKAEAEKVDYGGVRNVLAALGGRSVRIALMTAIGVTNREGDYNRRTEAHDWKRRGERLVRVSGLPYTIVRPGWFDYNKADEHRLRATTSSMSSTANMMRRMPSVFGGALFASALSAVGLRNFVSSTRPWPSGVRIIAISDRTPSSPMRRSTERPSTCASPSSSRPSSFKKATAAARSSTTTPTLSIRLSVLPLNLSLAAPVQTAAADDRVR